MIFPRQISHWWYIRKTWHNSIWSTNKRDWYKKPKVDMKTYRQWLDYLPVMNTGLGHQWANFKFRTFLHVQKVLFLSLMIPPFLLHRDYRIYRAKIKYVHLTVRITKRILTSFRHQTHNRLQAILTWWLCTNLQM